MPHNSLNPMSLAGQNAAQFASFTTCPHPYSFQPFCLIQNTAGVGIKSQDETDISSARPGPQKRISILVVDDDDRFRGSLVNSLLELSNFEIETDQADSGEETLDKLTDGGHRFDWIFLDVKLPGMDGVETYNRIKAINPDIGIIVMTSDRNVAVRAESAIGNKVFNKNKLYLELNSILSNKTGEYRS